MPPNSINSNWITSTTTSDATPELVRGEGDDREDRIVPEEVSKFFGCSRLTVSSTLNMPADQGFYALVTLGGEGVLRGNFDDVPLKRGKSVFIPRCLSSYDIVSTGDTPMEIICCYPPSL